MIGSHEVLFAQLRTILGEKLRIPAGEIEPGASSLDLGLDSLDLVELSSLLAKQCGVQVGVKELFGAETLDDIVWLMEKTAGSAQ